MDRAGHQTCGQTIDTNITATAHDFAHGVVVWQHADDDLAVQEVAEISRRPETGRLKTGDLVRSADIGNHPSSGASKVGGHRHSHMTKADKADFAQHRPTAS